MEDVTNSDGKKIFVKASDDKSVEIANQLSSTPDHIDDLRAKFAQHTSGSSGDIPVTEVPNNSAVTTLASSEVKVENPKSEVEPVASVSFSAAVQSVVDRANSESRVDSPFRLGKFVGNYFASLSNVSAYLDHHAARFMGSGVGNAEVPPPTQSDQFPRSLMERTIMRPTLRAWFWITVGLLIKYLSWTFWHAAHFTNTVFWWSNTVAIVLGYIVLSNGFWIVLYPFGEIRNAALLLHPFQYVKWSADAVRSALYYLAVWVINPINQLVCDFKTLFRPRAPPPTYIERASKSIYDTLLSAGATAEEAGSFFRRIVDESTDPNFCELHPFTCLLVIVGMLALFAFALKLWMNWSELKRALETTDTKAVVAVTTPAPVVSEPAVTLHGGQGKGSNVGKTGKALVREKKQSYAIYQVDYIKRRIDDGFSDGELYVEKDGETKMFRGDDEYFYKKGLFNLAEDELRKGSKVYFNDPEYGSHELALKGDKRLRPSKFETNPDNDMEMLPAEKKRGRGKDDLNDGKMTKEEILDYLEEEYIERRFSAATASIASAINDQGLEPLRKQIEIIKETLAKNNHEIEIDKLRKTLQSTLSTMEKISKEQQVLNQNVNQVLNRPHSSDNDIKAYVNESMSTLNELLIETQNRVEALSVALHASVSEQNKKIVETAEQVRLANLKKTEGQAVIKPDKQEIPLKQSMETVQGSQHAAPRKTVILKAALPTSQEVITPEMAKEASRQQKLKRKEANKRALEQKILEGVAKALASKEKHAMPPKASDATGNNTEPNVYDLSWNYEKMQQHELTYSAKAGTVEVVDKIGGHIGWATAVHKTWTNIKGTHARVLAVPAHLWEECEPEFFVYQGIRELITKESIPIIGKDGQIIDTGDFRFYPIPKSYLDQKVNIRSFPLRHADHVYTPDRPYTIETIKLFKKADGGIEYLVVAETAMNDHILNVSTPGDSGAPVLNSRDGGYYEGFVQGTTTMMSTDGRPSKVACANICFINPSWLDGAFTKATAPASKN